MEQTARKPFRLRFRPINPRPLSAVVPKDALDSPRFETDFAAVYHR